MGRLSTTECTYLPTYLDKGSCSMQRVCGQRIIGHTEKGIIPGVCLGSSAANALSFAFVLQVGR